MMFRYLGWTEAADLIVKGLNGAIGSKRVTYDFARHDGGREGNQVLRVRREHHRAHVRDRFRMAVAMGDGPRSNRKLTEDERAIPAQAATS